MPQFVDNVLLPPSSTLPILGIVVGPGESDRILRIAQAVYKRNDLRNGRSIDIRAAFCTRRMVAIKIRS